MKRVVAKCFLLFQTPAILSQIVIRPSLIHMSEGGTVFSFTRVGIDQNFQMKRFTRFLSRTRDSELKSKLANRSKRRANIVVFYQGNVAFEKKQGHGFEQYRMDNS